MLNIAKIFAALLVVLGVLIGVYAWMLSRAPAHPAAAPATAKSQAASRPIVVAAKALPAGQIIKPDDVKREESALPMADVIQDASAVVGRAPVVDLAAGQPVTEAMLSRGLAAKLAEGERAVAVKVDETIGVGNKIRPGDFVDVFFLLKRDNGEIDHSQSRLLLARKRVLAYGAASLDAMPSEAGGAGSNAAAAQRQEVARTAVLAVAVDEVNRLALGDTSGRLVLALRNPKDETQPDDSLFAALPMALPVSSGKRSQLSSSDKAQAGVALTALASGGTRAAQSAALRTPAVPRAVPKGGTASPPVASTLEIIRGGKQEVLTY